MVMAAENGKRSKIGRASSIIPFGLFSMLFYLLPQVAAEYNWDVETFLDAVPEDVTVVVDEAYFDFADARDYPDTVAQYDDVYPEIVTLRTFSSISFFFAVILK